MLFRISAAELVCPNAGSHHLRPRCLPRLLFPADSTRYLQDHPDRLQQHLLHYHLFHRFRHFQRYHRAPVPFSMKCAAVDLLMQIPREAIAPPPPPDIAVPARYHRSPRYRPCRHGPPTAPAPPEPPLPPTPPVPAVLPVQRYLFTMTVEAQVKIAPPSPPVEVVPPLPPVPPFPPGAVAAPPAPPPPTVSTMTGEIISTKSVLVMVRVPVPISGWHHHCHPSARTRHYHPRNPADPSVPLPPETAIPAAIFPKMNYG